MRPTLVRTSPYPLILLTALCLWSCGSDGETAGESSQPEEPETVDLSCEAQPDPRCDHPIDRLLLPMLRKIEVEPRQASAEELCRRMYVDLVGRIPTPDQLDACLPLTPPEMVEMLMDRPEYEWVQRQYWAIRLGYRVGRTIHWQIFDLDEWVGRLVRGEIGYAEFATEAVTHPGFVVPHIEGNTWAEGVFNTFIGRPPRPDEVNRTRPLARPLRGRIACDGRLSENIYQECLRREAAGEEVDRPCERRCDLFTIEGAFFPCGCTPYEDPAGDGESVFVCAGDGLGELVDLGIAECTDASEFELFRTMDYTAGRGDGCPDREEPCLDLEVSYATEEPEIYPAGPLPPISADDRERLRRIGAALTARRDFWEAAVDQELTTLLGWWKSGFSQPDFDVPVVRDLLVEVLRDTGSLREVQELILTSLLYTAPARVEEVPDITVDERPPWSMGPLKLLSGTRWLDSASAVAGEVLGICDHRFLSVEPELATGVWYLSEVGYTEPSTLSLDSLLGELGMQLEGEELEAAYIAFYELTEYRNLASQLGGCVVDPPPATPSLSFVSRQSEIASLLCMLGRDAVPRPFDREDRSDAGLERIARHLVRRALTREADPDEIDLLVAEMRSCLDEGDCTTAETAARWLCARVLDSSLFSLY